MLKMVVQSVVRRVMQRWCCRTCCSWWCSVMVQGGGEVSAVHGALLLTAQ